MASIKPLNCPQETAETACQLGATLKLSKLTLGVICVGPHSSGLRAPFLPLFCPMWLSQVSDNWAFLDTCLSSFFCCCDKQQISACEGESLIWLTGEGAVHHGGKSTTAEAPSSCSHYITGEAEKDEHGRSACSRQDSSPRDGAYLT